MKEDNIIDFSESRLNLIIKKPEKYCECLNVYVVVSTRMLECRACGNTIEPFEYILKSAEMDYNLFYRTKEAYDELSKLGKSIKKLKIEERNIKARLKRLINKPTQG